MLQVEENEQTQVQSLQVSVSVNVSMGRAELKTGRRCVKCGNIPMSLGFPNLAVISAMRLNVSKSRVTLG